ncbi:MAG: ATP-binding protein, partial [Chthoniobacteraceae bacterium]
MSADDSNGQLPASAAGSEPVRDVHALNRRDEQFFEDLTRTNNELANLQREVARKNAELLREIAARIKAEAALEVEHRERLEISHRAGMAEVATSVLHNVGNVLNSVNVSATMLADLIRDTPVNDLVRVVALLQQQGANLAAFFADDPRAPDVIGFLAELSATFTRQQETQRAEVASLQQNIEHIKDIVAMQQSCARVSGVVENLDVAELVDDTLRLNAVSFSRHEVAVVREFAPDLPPVATERHKVLQILVNLLLNAEAACIESGRAEKLVTVRASHAAGRVRIQVADNGCDIAPENLDRIFNHGFTTK